MEESPMANSNLKKELSTVVERNESLFQENYVLKKKIELLEKITSELEIDLSVLNNGNHQEQLEHQSLRTELNLANSKISHLEEQLEEEKANVQILVEETKKKQEQITTVSQSTLSNNSEHINMLSSQIETLLMDQEKDKQSIKELTNKEMLINFEKLELKKANETIHNEIEDFKKHLAAKNEEIQKLKEALESVQEEKFLLSSELQMHKASESTAERGNSLFGELEENRQKAVAQREMLKIKYLNLKKVFSQKQVENNKLKLEIAKIRREEVDEEKHIRKDYADLVETYKERISELEEQLRLTKHTPLQPPTESAEKWVNTVVENARKETKTFKDELERRGSNFVIQGQKLFESQKQNRKLKSTIAKMQADIDELKLNLDIMKAGTEELKDGISPPAIETIVAYKKTVSFKEVLKDNNDSSRDGNDVVTVKHELKEEEEKENT